MLVSILAQGLGFILVCGLVGWQIGGWLADLVERWEDEDGL